MFDLIMGAALWILMFVYFPTSVFLLFLIICVYYSIKKTSNTNIKKEDLNYLNGVTSSIQQQQQSK